MPPPCSGLPSFRSSYIYRLVFLVSHRFHGRHARGTCPPFAHLSSWFPGFTSVSLTSRRTYPFPSFRMSTVLSSWFHVGFIDVTSNLPLALLSQFAHLPSCRPGFTSVSLTVTSHRTYPLPSFRIYLVLSSWFHIGFTDVTSNLPLALLSQFAHYRFVFLVSLRFH